MGIYSQIVWYVAKVTMRIFKWSPYFSVDRESSLVPVWISLPRLPIIFFAKPALFRIASLVETPLRLDAATLMLKRLGVARMQVKIDILKPRPHHIWLGMGSVSSLWQKLEYEHVPDYCTLCWHVGHAESICNARPPTLPVVVKEGRRPAKSHLEYRPIQPSVAEQRPLVINAGNPAQTGADNIVEDAVGKPPGVSAAPEAIAHSAGVDIAGDKSAPQQKLNMSSECLAGSLSELQVTSEVLPAKAPLVVEVTPSSDEDQSLVIVEGNRFSCLEGLDDQEQTIARDQSAMPTDHASVQREIPMSTALQIVLKSIDSAVSPQVSLHDKHMAPSPLMDNLDQSPVNPAIHSPSNVSPQRELIVMLPPIISVPIGDEATLTTSNAASKSDLYTTPSHIRSQQMFQEQGPQIHFQNNMTQSIMDFQPYMAQVSRRDTDEESMGEESMYEDDDQDFLDKHYIRDDIYL